jgi:hypothetical protein
MTTIPKRKIGGAAAAITLLLSSTLAQADPANDDFLSATRLSGNFTQLEGTTVGSSEEAGEPDIFTSYRNRRGSVWYRWVSPDRRGNLTLALEVFMSNGGSVFGFNHGIDLYQSSNDSIFDLNYLGGGDVDGGQVDSGTWAISSNTTYYIRVAFLANDAASPFEVTLNFSPDPKSSPAYLRASLKSQIKKAYRNLRAAQQKGNASSAKKIRRNIAQLKRALRRV